MRINELTDIVGYVAALSIATERLVEITKGFIPFLNKKDLSPEQENNRRSLLQILAVFAGVVVAFLAKDSLPDGSSNMSLVLLGLLASGGSGFWNVILTYLTGLKDLTKIEVADAKRLDLPVIPPQPPSS